MTKNVGWGNKITHPSKGAFYSRQDGTYRNTNTGEIAVLRNGRLMVIGREKTRRNIYGADPIKPIQIKRLKKLK